MRGGATPSRTAIAVKCVALDPRCSEGVQNQFIFDAEPGGIVDRLIRIGDNLIAAGAPGFVADHPATMLASRVRGVLVAVIPLGSLDCARHNHPPTPPRFLDSRKSVRFEAMTRAECGNHGPKLCERRHNSP